MATGHGFTRYDVISLGFEARCFSSDGASYLWHADCGLRTDQDGLATMLTDVALLPEGPWALTELGERELHEGQLWV
jgi:hypothetical protein